MTGEEEQAKRRRQISVLQTPYADCDICKAESVQTLTDGTRMGVETATIMNGMDRVLSLCHECWTRILIMGSSPEQW